MASKSLPVRCNRRFRTQLSHFIETLSVFVGAGHELNSAWSLALKSLEGRGPDLWKKAMEMEGGGSMTQTLSRLSEHYPVPLHRNWFHTLHDLYRQGTGLNDVLKSFSDALQREEELDLDTFIRTLPTRLNIGLTLIFFPATLIATLVPLLLEMLSAF